MREHRKNPERTGIYSVVPGAKSPNPICNLGLLLCFGVDDGFEIFVLLIAEF
jgi:hypothetical protein